MGRIKGCKGDGTDGEVIEGADLVIEVHPNSTLQSYTTPRLKLASREDLSLRSFVGYPGNSGSQIGLVQTAWRPIASSYDIGQ